MCRRPHSPPLHQSGSQSRNGFGGFEPPGPQAPAPLAAPPPSGAPPSIDSPRQVRVRVRVAAPIYDWVQHAQTHIRPCETYPSMRPCTPVRPHRSQVRVWQRFLLRWVYPKMPMQWCVLLLVWAMAAVVAIILHRYLHPNPTFSLPQSRP